MDEYYYAKIAFNAYNMEMLAEPGQTSDNLELDWHQVPEFEKQAWKACTAAITKEVNKYWYRSMKKKGGQ